LRRAAVLKFFASLKPCRVGMEACGSAHYWARQIGGLGHEVRLMAPQYGRAYVKRNKNDAADAEAICEAVGRANMRFVVVKSAEQQSLVMLHRARQLLIRQRTMLINAVRGHLMEFGIVAAQGRKKMDELVGVIVDARDDRLPAMARRSLGMLVDQLHDSERKLVALESDVVAWTRTNEASRRLASIPGVGVITASALVATVGDARQFRSGREFAAWIGLVPRQHSSGGKPRLGGISKRGDGYLRRLLIHGARTVIRWRRTGGASPWLAGLLARRHVNVVTTALANKNARIAWAILSRGETYVPRHRPAAS
jgi:transposase